MFDRKWWKRNWIEMSIRIWQCCFVFWKIFRISGSHTKLVSPECYCCLTNIKQTSHLTRAHLTRARSSQLTSPTLLALKFIHFKQKRATSFQFWNFCFKLFFYFRLTNVKNRLHIKLTCFLYFQRILIFFKYHMICSFWSKPSTKWQLLAYVSIHRIKTPYVPNSSYILQDKNSHWKQPSLPLKKCGFLTSQTLPDFTDLGLSLADHQGSQSMHQYQERLQTTERKHWCIWTVGAYGLCEI